MGRAPAESRGVAVSRETLIARPKRRPTISRRSPVVGGRGTPQHPLRDMDSWQQWTTHSIERSELTRAVPRKRMWSGTNAESPHRIEPPHQAFHVKQSSRVSCLTSVQPQITRCRKANDPSDRLAPVRGLDPGTTRTQAVSPFHVKQSSRPLHPTSTQREAAALWCNHDPLIPAVPCDAPHGRPARAQVTACVSRETSVRAAISHARCANVRSEGRPPRR